ncbi:MAG TPA: DUF3575 domain-containing protein [Flavobacterium sp.]|jgi:hypothetical protein
MKNFILAISALVLSYSASAQVAQDSVYVGNSSVGLPQHEVKWNIANTIIFASFEVGYEYFLDGHQSVGAEFLINDVYNFSIGREVKDFDTNSFQLTYNYYTGAEANGSGFVISPMIKFRTGEYQKTDADPVVDMNSFILGIGGGYKWNLNNKFVFGPYINIGRNFSDEVNDEFNIAVEFNAGFLVGYRF